MFLILSKLVDVLLEPLVWTIGLVLAAWVLRARARLSAGLLFAGLTVLYLFSLEPVALGLMRFTERNALSTFDPDAPYDAVIVLGGGLDPIATERAGELEFNEAPERFLRAYELLRSGKSAHVVISGGSLDPRPGATVEADVFARQLEEWGIARERILVENESRNTRENAVLTAELLASRGWDRVLLVSSAFHLERAHGCFRAVGLDPDVLPVDFRGVSGGSITPQDFLPRATYLDRSSDAIRELFGRFVYRLVGYAE